MLLEILHSHCREIEQFVRDDVCPIEIRRVLDVIQQAIHLVQNLKDETAGHQWFIYSTLD